MCLIGIAGRYFPITEQQAKEAWGERYTEFYNDAYPAYIAGYEFISVPGLIDANFS